MKFFFKNRKKAFTLSELLVSSVILVMVFSVIFWFVTNNLGYIKYSSKESEFEKVEKFQKEISNKDIDLKGFHKKDFLQDRYIRFYNLWEYFVIFYENWKLWTSLSLSTVYENPSNIRFDNLENWNILEVESATIREFRSQKYKTKGSVYKIDFRLKWWKQDFSLYL